MTSVRWTRTLMLFSTIFSAIVLWSLEVFPSTFMKGVAGLYAGEPKLKNHPSKLNGSNFYLV
jgi:hypothetical protein